MNFGLKTYLAEEAKRYNVVLVKKKLFCNHRKDKHDHDVYEWSVVDSKSVITLWPSTVLIGLETKLQRLVYKSATSKGGSRLDVNGEDLSFNPSNFDELVKLQAIKGLA